MSSFGRNIFSVIAEHASKPVSDSEKGQGDWKLNRLINLLRDGKDAEIECMLQESSYELKRKKDTNGWSLLHHAAKQGRAEAAELLLEEGAYVNARDRDDNTPLHIACLSVAAAVAHRLVLYGADVEVRNKEGKSPLQLSEKFETTLAVVLTRVLCNPRSTLLFPSRLKFMETFEAFVSEKCNDYMNGQHVYDNVDDFYRLFCVVRSYGGNNKCNVGKKWKGVTSELMISSVASDDPGSWQVTYQTYLHQYEMYYNKIIKQLDGRRRRFTQSKCDVERKWRSNGRIVMCKKSKAYTSKKRRIEPMKTESKAPLFDIFARNLGGLKGGCSSSLQVFDQSCVDLLELSVAGPEKPRERCVPTVAAQISSSSKDDEKEFTHEYHYLRKKRFLGTLYGHPSYRTYDKDVACVKMYSEKLPSRRKHFPRNDDVMPATNGLNRECFCGLKPFCQPVFSNGVGSKQVDDDTGRWISSRDQRANGSTPLDVCCNDELHDSDIELDGSYTKELQPSLSFSLHNGLETRQNCLRGESPRHYINKRATNTEEQLPWEECVQKRYVAENVSAAGETWKKDPEVIILDSDDEETEQNTQESMSIGIGDVSADSSTGSCLMDEVAEGRSDVCKRLQGMVPRRGAGECLLHAAARYGDVEAVQCLLGRGISVNVKDHAGWTPLHEAVRERQLAVAEFLLQRGAEVNTGSTDGTRPLHDAAESDDMVAVQMLLERGAVATAENYGGETAYTLTSCSQIRSLLREYICNATRGPGTGQASGHSADRQFSDASDDAELSSLVMSGQFSYGPAFEMWERPPPPLFCVSLSTMHPNRRCSCLLFSDLLKYLGTDETSFACNYPDVELVPVEIGHFRSQLASLMLCHCEVNFQCSNDTEIILVQYSERVREILGVDVVYWVN